MRVQDRTPERLGPYRLLRRLGEGGMGVVYLAVDLAGLPVAVKVLHPGMAREDTARRRLAREVETMRLVRSRYVAEVLDADLEGDQPYIVTRYVPGLALDDVVSTGGPLTGPALARFGCGLTQALAAVHAAGVVHRDLKPGNVMISDGEPVVIDFGIARLPETTRLTMTGMFMGTPGYLAPEVIEGMDSGPASDVHSLAATLAFAATGRPPYGSGAFEAIFYRIVHGQPDLGGLPVPLVPAIATALSRDPARRPSAAALAAQLAALDPATLTPGPARTLTSSTAAAGPDQWPGAPGGPTATVMDGFGIPADLRDNTRPLPANGVADVLDLLPPVRHVNGGGQAGVLGYGPGGAGVAGAAMPGAGWPPGPGQAGAAGGAAWAGQGTGAAVAGQGAGRWAGGGLAGQGLAGQGLAGQGLAGQGLAGQGLPGGGSPGAGSAGGGLAGARGAQRPGPVSAWSPLVLATVAMVVAISVMAPIGGTVIALALLVALRAVGTTGRQLARRRARDGRRSSDLVVAVALFPVAVLRGLLGLVLVAPLALLGFCVAAAAVIMAVPVHPLPQAVALGAGALVAVVGIGPGSRGSRTVLASLYSSVARTPSRLAVAYVGILALAAWASLTAWSAWPTPAYWPVASLHAELVHLPTVRTILTDVRQHLLMVARQFGL